MRVTDTHRSGRGIAGVLARNEPVRVPETPRAPAAQRSPWPPRVVAAAVIACFIVRLIFLLTPAGTLDGDEAITGIMAHRMARGQSFPVFFLGQNYGGSLEQLPQALLFRLGVPENALTLRLPQLAIASLGCWLMYVVGLRLLKSRWHAALASVLFAVGPYFLIWEGSRSNGGYRVEMALGLLGLLLAVDIGRETDPRRELRLIAMVGLVCGATYWLALSGFYLLIPALLWILPTLGRHARKWLAAGAGVLCGLLPVLYWTVRNGSFPVPDAWTPPTSARQRFGNLTDEIGREFLGMAHLSGHPGWPVWPARIVLIGLIAAVLLAIAIRWRSVRQLLALRTQGRQPFDMVLIAVPLSLAAYTASRFAWFVKEPRYLFCTYPILLFGLAQLVPKRRAAGIAVGLTVFAFVALPSMTMLVTHADDVPAHRDRDLSRAINVLTNEHTTFVYANYWTATPLQFLAGDRLTVGSFVTPERLLAGRRAVDASPSPVWVAANGPDSNDIPPMRAALVSHGVRFRERRFGVVSIFDRFSRTVRPWQVGLGGPLR